MAPIHDKQRSITSTHHASPPRVIGCISCTYALFASAANSGKAPVSAHCSAAILQNSVYRRQTASHATSFIAMRNQTHSLVAHCFQLSLLYVQNPDCSDHLPPPLRLPCVLVQCSTKTGITTRVVKRSSDPLHILLSAKPRPFRRDRYRNSPVTVFRLHLYRNAIDSERRFEANSRVY